jgi:hypothetical protein
LGWRGVGKHVVVVGRLSISSTSLDTAGIRYSGWPNVSFGLEEVRGYLCIIGSDPPGIIAVVIGIVVGKMMRRGL